MVHVRISRGQWLNARGSVIQIPFQWANLYSCPNSSTNVITCGTAGWATDVCNDNVGEWKWESANVSVAQVAVSSETSSVSQFPTSTISTNSASTTLGAGLGAGLGVPLLVVSGYLIYFCVRMRRQVHTMEQQGKCLSEQSSYVHGPVEIATQPHNLATGSAGIDVPELSDLVYEKSMGGGRFMKSIRARQQNGIVFVKVIMKPYPALKLEPYVKAISRERELLLEVPNALSYQRILETSIGGYLVRQYIHSSLYDRMSTRPFPEDIEKKWIAFQLLCALRDCHSLNVYHGDIKTENVLVTSWNWLYLTDFSSSFKPTFLPEDNPAEFSFYFDTSGRRTCYLAPERFLVAGEEPGSRQVNWAMDIFSAGCVIAELFLESPIFTLSQIFKYRKSEYSPEHGQLAKIEDPEIRSLILHMIQLDPESRYSAEEYLNFWKEKAFPEYFYSFLHQYMSLMTDPSSGRAQATTELASRSEADDRIERVYFDFDKISYFLGSSKPEKDGSDRTTTRLTGNMFPVHLDLPRYGNQNAKPQRQADDGVLIFLTLVVSNLRNTSKSSARIKACDILLAFAERLSDEAKLDRILPYIMILLNDRTDSVKVAAIRTLADLLEMVHVVSPVNAYLFSEYIFPRLQPFVPNSTSSPSTLVRAAYASSIASLAESSLRFLDMIQALRSDTRLPALIPAGSEPRWTEDATYHNLYDVARIDLLEYFEAHTKALLTDTDASVRRAFLGSVSSLCVFFGNLKTNEVILSHLNTYLNDRDWILKCAFFEAVVGVAAYVGSISLEQYILPLMVQSMTDPEEFVVEKVIRSLASMASLGLFQRSTTWAILHIAVCFLVHPNGWIREAALTLVVNSTKFLSLADRYSILKPLIKPFLKVNIVNFTEGELLDALKGPLPRGVYELAFVWLSKADKGLFWRSASRDGVFILDGADGIIPKSSQRSSIQTLSSQPKNEEDEQWILRLRNMGMAPEDEVKLMALREYIWRVSMRQAKDADTGTSPLNNVLTLTHCGVTPQTVFFDKNQNSKPRRSPPAKLETRRMQDRKLHTITDALLDASTTLDNVPGSRRRHMRSRTHPQRDIDTTLKVPRQNAMDGVRAAEDSLVSSPIASSPSAAPGSRPLSPLASDTERRVSGGRNSPGQDSSSTPTDAENPAIKTLTSGVQRKPSAMSLLNRKEYSKAYAETSTSSANAFGKVDVPIQREASQPSTLPTSIERKSADRGLHDYHVNHSYGGDDPVILKLLDNVFAENYPTDLFDLGPYVKEVDTKRPIQNANGNEQNKVWKPEGGLVAIFGEHKGPVNRVIVAPDHAFFITASDDGTVKIWDTTRLERNLTPRSRQTYRHSTDAKVKTLTFVENTHTFISGATDGSLHVVKIDYHNANETVRYGKLQFVREYRLPEAEDGSVEYPVWVEHFRVDAQSILLVATNTCRILAIDMKTMLPIYTLQNPVHHGTPTTFCCDRKHNWLLIGTTHGLLDLWDLRFRVRLKAWGLPASSAIHRLQVHPTKGRGRWVCVSGGGSRGNEITVWDIEKVRCREVYRADSPQSGNGDSNGGHGDYIKSRPPYMSAKEYEPWHAEGDRPEGMLSRFATGGPASGAVEQASGPSSTIMPARVCAFAVGFDSPDDGKDNSTRCGFIVSGGTDRKIRFWDLARPELSGIVSGLEAVSDGVATGKPRYELSQPGPSLLVTTEHLPNALPSGTNGKGGSKKGGSGRLPRSTVISLQQQQLLKSHLDFIQDVAVLRVPYGMVVSVDRAGMVYVFR
ncbi:Serine/threonine-protein kinase [Aspergillus nanangensis]|uniref:non-specific serine/threonine protein kinase n=1 Tax=Aspergillus nanangensis TaxID=2582783 RepID=A0AAD4CHF8_ASPNN|nr:Serine/threonine-protein kinase [Aspergillus nanangensis]